MKKNFSSQDRIFELIKYYNITNLSSLARSIGLFDEGRIRRIYIGKEEITRAVAELIVEQFPEINFDWLMTGDGPMLGERQPEEKLLGEIVIRMQVVACDK